MPRWPLHTLFYSIEEFQRSARLVAYWKRYVLQVTRLIRDLIQWLLVSSRLAKVVFVLLECRTCSPVSLEIRITRQSRTGCRGHGHDHVVARKEEGNLHCPIQALHRYGLAGRIAALLPLFLGACVGRSEGYNDEYDMQEAPSH